jgi:thioredoxin-related protein
MNARVKFQKFAGALVLLLGAALLVTDVSFSASTPAGRMSGGRAHTFPDWFKASFLNFKEEAEEARQAGRHVLVFMDLNDCPYCARTLDENFRQGDNVDFIRKNFDVIAVNVRGANEVTWIDGETLTEQALAVKLKVGATPALVFIDPDGKKVLQLNGYRTPPTLRQVLEYVHDKAYRRQSLAEYLEKKKRPPAYSLRSHPRFETVTDFAHIQNPLVVIFEDTYCADCDGFHDKVLNHPDVLTELKPFRVVRLDATADTSLDALAESKRAETEEA